MRKKFVSKRMGFPARPKPGRDIGFTVFNCIADGPAAITFLRSTSILALEEDCLGGLCLAERLGGLCLAERLGGLCLDEECLGGLCLADECLGGLSLDDEGLAVDKRLGDEARGVEEEGFFDEEFLSGRFDGMVKCGGNQQEGLYASERRKRLTFKLLCNDKEKI